ncbi:MAG: tRNA adenosine(34) deaminase TadA [Proteobacteria bacterium]|nr:tRNA adenosine(34) deaminase TadA [Pseudomonadota bacterium]MBU1709473.1 tRNA adenosine(34) deaminase TadA [Pseudomonadota bacterium]
MDSDSKYMEMALEEAAMAAERGEVPVGAVIVDQDGVILAQDGNRSIELSDPAGHAEILVMRAAGEKTGNYRLAGLSLYVTLEPCVMCAGAMVHARISRLIYGASDPKAGAVESLYGIGRDGKLNHALEVTGGVWADQASSMLKDFFKKRRG